MNDKNENWVYLLESDFDALARASRPAQITTFIVFSFLLTVACCAWWLGPPDGRKPWQPLLIVLWCIGLLTCAVLCFRLRTMSDHSVWLGRDFLAGSICTMGSEKSAADNWSKIPWHTTSLLLCYWPKAHNAGVQGQSL